MPPISIAELGRPVTGGSVLWTCGWLVAVGSLMWHVEYWNWKWKLTAPSQAWHCLGATALAAQHFSLQQRRSPEEKGVWPALGRGGQGGPHRRGAQAAARAFPKGGSAPAHLCILVQDLVLSKMSYLLKCSGHCQ